MCLYQSVKAGLIKFDSSPHWLGVHADTAPCSFYTLEKAESLRVFPHLLEKLAWV